MLFKPKNIVHYFIGTAGATLCSRLLGLVRVMLEARFLGGGAVASGWLLAWMVPNTFRRTLGEGALGNVLTPFVTHDVAENGREHTRYDLAAIFAVLSLILLFIAITIAVISQVALLYVTIPRYRLMLQLLPLLMPYLVFICLIGAVNSVLATLRIFVLPAFAALLLNIALIGSLLLSGYYLFPDAKGGGVADNGAIFHRMLNYLAITVVVAGFIQLLIVVWVLYRHGMFPIFNRYALQHRRAVAAVTKSTFISSISGGSTQISALIDKGIASIIGPLAVPALAYSDRIVLLPVGVLGVALGTILLSTLSADLAAGRLKAVTESLSEALKAMLIICIPIALFTMLFREDMITVLYFRGNFSQENLVATSQAMFFYAAGIPFFVCLKPLTAAFYAQQRISTPTKVAVICLVLNTILNITLVYPLRQGGIALATVISSLTNNILLIILLRRTRIVVGLRPLLSVIIRSTIATAGALTLSMLTGQWLVPALSMPSSAIWRLLFGSISFCITYLILIILIGGRDIRRIIAKLLNVCH